MKQDEDRLLVPIPVTQYQLGGVSRPTVYRLVERGELTKVNIGARGFITAKSLAAYVDRLSGEGPRNTSGDVTVGDVTVGGGDAA